MMISLDGYFEGKNHDLSWHNVDGEFNEFAIRQLKSIGTILFGRKTYSMMSQYWPTNMAKSDDPIVAGLMNTTKKIVFSGTLKIAKWQNTKLISDYTVEEVKKLKNEPGKDIAIFGSNNLCVYLTEHGLVDEFRIIINPVAIGKGTPLFKGLKKKLKLELIKTHNFKSGNALLCYQPVK